MTASAPRKILPQGTASAEGGRGQGIRDKNLVFEEVSRYRLGIGRSAELNKAIAILPLKRKA